MKLTVIFVQLTFIFVILSCQSDAHISINFDREDLDEIGDFVDNHININPLRSVQSSRNIIIKKGKAFVLWIFQLAGVTAALVSSNVITTRLSLDQAVVPPPPPQCHEPKIEISKLPTQKTKFESKETDNISAKISELCQIDFGCHKNVCWRSCHTNNQSENLWCYTSPTPNRREFYHCESSNDCFICWECIEPCHA